MDREVEDDKLVLFCYGNPGLERRLSGDKDFLREGSELVLTNCDDGSLIVDQLCD